MIIIDVFYLSIQQQYHMLSQLIIKSMACIARAPKIKTVRQRIKFYSRYPDAFKLKTLIRPPDLRQPNMTFPITIPIRYRHIYEPKKKPIVDNSTKIHWNQLQPNQILLAFQNVKYLSFKEIVEGLRVLAEVKGQEKHDWNNHEWVSAALKAVKDNFIKIKKPDIMNFYFLMKKLRYNDEQFWKKLYAAIEENVYDFYPGQFEYIYETYYDVAQKYFSPNAKKNFDKLMQGRLRQFSPAAIISIFSKYIRDNKMDNYWLENVFISLFKDNRYRFTPKQVATIFRSMMILNHQHNDRLYESLYNRVKTLKFTQLEEIQLLEEVFLQVKQIFISHRVDPTLQILQQKKKEVIELKKQAKKKTIEQMVRDDLKYFLQKRKLKDQQKGASSAGAV